MSKSLTKVSTCGRVKTTIRKNNFGEYVVRTHVDGQFLGKATNYYTDNKEDATHKADALLQRRATSINT